MNIGLELRIPKHVRVFQIPLYVGINGHTSSFIHMYM